jgi:hypothetical protein
MGIQRVQVRAVARQIRPFSPERVRENVAFADMTPEEVKHLAWMAEQYRNGLAPELNNFDDYECQVWTKEQLARTGTIAAAA